MACALLHIFVNGLATVELMALLVVVNGWLPEKPLMQNRKERAARSSWGGIAHSAVHA